MAFRNDNVDDGSAWKELPSWVIEAAMPQAIAELKRQEQAGNEDNADVVQTVLASMNEELARRSKKN